MRQKVARVPVVRRRARTREIRRVGELGEDASRLHVGPPPLALAGRAHPRRRFPQHARRGAASGRREVHRERLVGECAPQPGVEDQHRRRRLQLRDEPLDRLLPPEPPPWRKPALGHRALAQVGQRRPRRPVAHERRRLVEHVDKRQVDRADHAGAFGSDDLAPEEAVLDRLAAHRPRVLAVAIAVVVGRESLDRPRVEGHPVEPFALLHQARELGGAQLDAAVQ
eukprot:854206-Prymnesium_polylepis.1